MRAMSLVLLSQWLCLIFYALEGVHGLTCFANRIFMLRVRGRLHCCWELSDCAEISVWLLNMELFDVKYCSALK